VYCTSPFPNDQVSHTVSARLIIRSCGLAPDSALQFRIPDGAPCFNVQMIVIVAGLPGTGKTTLAREISSRVSGRVLGKDEIRHAIFSGDEIEYSTRQDDFCLRVMMETADYLLDRQPGRSIFLDGRPFSRRYQLDNAIAAAASMHQPWRIFECVCSDETARLRLQKDAESKTHQAGNRDYELYLEVKSRYETIVHPKTVIDTDQALDTSVDQALAALR
jgi:predicted kinase